MLGIPNTSKHIRSNAQANVDTRDHKCTITAYNALRMYLDYLPDLTRHLQRTKKGQTLHEEDQVVDCLTAEVLYCPSGRSAAHSQGHPRLPPNAPQEGESWAKCGMFDTAGIFNA